MQDSGDGAGVMTAVPWELLSSVKEADRASTGVGMVFLPQDPEKAKAAMAVIESKCGCDHRGHV